LDRTINRALLGFTSIPRRREHPFSHLTEWEVGLVGMWPPGTFRGLICAVVLTGRAEFDWGRDIHQLRGDGAQLCYLSNRRLWNSLPLFRGQWVDL